ncbi:hypothetical protein P280DRAFT_532397, partial [Massarina eburnea CBS 473.64]
QKAQKLARTRENQQRSRERKRVYLSEVEAKLRGYEQMGVEVSVEIQNAARRVLDENRKLRSILYERGVSEADLIEAMGGVRDNPYGHVSAASSLNTMLERRIVRNGPSCANSPVSTHSSVGALNRHMPLVPPPATLVPRSAAALGSNDCPSPHSTVSSMDTPPVYQGSPFYDSPITPTPDIDSEDIPPYMAYDQPFNNPWPYPGETHYAIEPTNHYNTSCIDAANIIRTMKSDTGPGLDSHLLGYHVQEHKYYINDPYFNTMDRYASP